MRTSQLLLIPHSIHSRPESHGLTRHSGTNHTSPVGSYAAEESTALSGQWYANGQNCSLTGAADAIENLT